ncbi:MAG: hypothetical protein KDD94_08925, partial [Calditrichaeota bacterium]|nr:hypothetical protein [Calditrichota bacterium]
MHKAIICFYLVCILAAQDVKTLAKSPLINDGMFVGKSGTIYTTVGGLRGGTQIGKVTPEGEVSVLSGGFSGTIDVYTDDEKTFYATNYDDNTVKRYDSASGKVVTIAEQLDGPASIARGKDGAFYISCFGAPPAYSGHTIVRLDPKSGKQSIFVESPLLFRPQGIVYDNGSFYVMNSPGGRMFRISESGKQIDNFTFIGAPIGNIVKKGSLFFGSSNRGNQLYVIDQHGNYMTLSGNGEPKTVDGSLETAQFFSPLGLALSPDGSLLYVAQSMDGV